LSALGAGLVLLSKAGLHQDTVDQWTFFSRLSVWKLGLQDIGEHPLVGIGYGNDTFVKRHPEYAPEVQDQYRERDRVPPSMHSALLMVTVGSGIPAMICLVWIFVRLIRLLLSRIQEVIGAPPALVALSIGLAVIGFGVRNLFDYMFMGSLSHLFWVLVVTGIALRHPGLIQGPR
jgi:heptosyltransferase-3/putative inorganic carbon (HCO3(-)) transporter